MISVVVICKDEPSLDPTLDAIERQLAEHPGSGEVVVIDASERRLDWIRVRHPDVRWIDFERPAGVRVSIPHQRNRGVAESVGDIVVFVDAGCDPRPGWLAELVAPILSGAEDVACGLALSPEGGLALYDSRIRETSTGKYLSEFPTINVALRRVVFDKVGGFDESFDYGSDMDFSWRVVDCGVKVRRVPAAIVEHDWGSLRRQLRRSYLYGQARIRLYRKHRGRLAAHWRDDPMVVVYPLYVASLPLALVFPPYLLLLAIPAWRSRHHAPLLTIADHLVFGVGGLCELMRIAGRQVMRT